MLLLTQFVARMKCKDPGGWMGDNRGTELAEPRRVVEVVTRNGRDAGAVTPG